MEWDAGGHARAAVGDELAVRQFGQRFVPRSVDRAGDRPGTLSIGFGSPRQRSGTRASTTTARRGAPRALGLDRVVGARLRQELHRLDLLLAAAKRPAPRGEVDHRGVVVAEVTQEPPEPFGAAHGAVRDDEDARPDPRAGRRCGELLDARQRMTPTRPGRRRQVALDVEERRAGNVPGEVEPASAPPDPRCPSGSRRSGRPRRGHVPLRTCSTSRL